MENNNGIIDLEGAISDIAKYEMAQRDRKSLSTPVISGYLCGMAKVYYVASRMADNDEYRDVLLRISQKFLACGVGRLFGDETSRNLSVRSVIDSLR